MQDAGSDDTARTAGAAEDQISVSGWLLDRATASYGSM